MENDIKVGVIGGGSWGTAIANLLGYNGYNLHLWVYEKEVKENIEKKRINHFFLPDIKLSENIIPTNDLKEAVSGKDIIVMVVPSHLVREITKSLKPFLKEETTIVIASKGIENKTHLTMSGVMKDVIEDLKDENVMVLSGPSFAKELALFLPTACTLAGVDEKKTKIVQKIFAAPFFRVYTNIDRIGVEVGGSFKNVIAIASGIVDGLKLGLNTRAALITRGLAEMKRIGLKLGGVPDTFSGLSGIGDLVLTCTGDLSRNHTVGKKIGEGEKLNEILEKMNMVAEGVKTTKSAYNLSKKLDIEMPITDCMYSVLYEDYTPNEAVKKLMTRKLKSEIE